MLSKTIQNDAITLAGAVYSYLGTNCLLFITDTTMYVPKKLNYNKTKGDADATSID
ncbi:hypothetical protein JCM14076_15280 [Methylosoma difficile]